MNYYMKTIKTTTIALTLILSAKIAVAQNDNGMQTAFNKSLQMEKRKIIKRL